MTRKRSLLQDNKISDRMVLFIEAFTDGACKKNPGIGGWGWVAYMKMQDWNAEMEWSDWGGERFSTNQRMELQAMAEFLEFCPKKATVEVWSDSSYVLGGIIGTPPKKNGAFKSSLVLVQSQPQGWIKGWTCQKKFGIEYLPSEYWTRSDLKNGLEWYRIHQSLLEHSSCKTKLSFGWIKGHSGNPGNEKADQLSNLYIRTELSDSID